MVSLSSRAQRQLPDSVAPALTVVRNSLAHSILGVYLFGSSVVGGLRPDSDLDILVVVEQPLPEAIRRDLVAGLMKVSGNGAKGGAARALEVTVINLSDVVPWRYPPKNELVYGEWLRAKFENGKVPPPASNPDLAIVLTKVRENSLPLCGPEARDLLDPVPVKDVHRAIADSLPTLIDELKGDERNVLLTLARMWVTLSTGEIVPKDAAAQRVMESSPAEHAPILELARRAYLGQCSDEWTHREHETAAFVRYARQEIHARLHGAHAPGGES